MRLWLRTSIGVLGLALSVSSAHAQGPAGTVLGHVTDALSQKPLQGVTLQIGSKTTVSKADGSYLLMGVPAGTDTLRGRMIGYAPSSQVVTVESGQTLIADVAMSAQAVDLSELVVVGYGEQQAGNITGAVTSVSPEEFNTGRIVSPQELIQSKAAGVQVVENNEPGGGTSVRIRGPSSVNASSEPLFVVDGMPLGTGSGTGISTGRDPLNFLNPDDIESITVLRDASAAGIYGANAANGVVLITTKTGKANQKPRVEYSASVSVSSITRRPDMLNAGQFRTAVQDFGAANVGELQNFNTDWFKQVDRTAAGQEHNLAFSGAGASSNYRFSLNFLDQQGIIQETKARRISLGVNYNQRLLSDKMSIKFNVRGSQVNDDFTPGGVLSNAAQMGPTQEVRDTTSTSGYYNWPDYPSPDNPVEILRLASDKSTSLRGVGNVQTEYQLPFLAGLSANLNLGFDATRAERTIFSPSILHAQQHGDHGNFTRSNPAQTNVIGEGYLNYAVPKTLGPGLLDLTAGYSYSQSRSEFDTTVARGLSTDILESDGIPAADIIQSRLNVQESKLISFFGRVNYNINDRYLAALSIRHDGSSRFGPSNQWGTFPSVAGAWRLSQEKFLSGVSALSDLKLRAAWGRTGNQSFGNGLQFSTYQIGDAQTQYQFGDTAVTTSRPSAVDPNIKWESTRSLNLGLDFGFSNQRFTGAIDWYDKKTTDLIFSVPVPGGTNFSNFVTTNIGSMRNRGLEFSLSAKVLQPNTSGKLSWTADVTAAHNSNKLLSINAGGATAILTGGVAGGVGTLIQVLTPGVPVNSFYVYTHKRDSNGKPIYADVNGDGNINENDLYVDVNGDGKVNVADRRPFHDPAPKWILGHSSYLTWKKWDASFTLRAYFGGYVYNNVASNLGNYEEVRRNSPYNLHASVLKTGFNSPQYLSDYYVENADFLRLDNITIGYTFNLVGQSARVFGTLQNAFTISDYSGVDPTAGINGIDNNIYPRSRTFTSGLSLRL